MLTLGDVLAQGDLGLSLVSGEASASGRLVAGAHSIEIDDPVRWLEPDWILLTTGLRLHDNPRRQRKLVADAADGGLAAIGFGQHDTDSVPPAMLKAALAADFPVFTVPHAVSLRLVATFVTSALADSRFLTLRRSEAAQTYLIDALSEARPAQVLIERLARLVDARAVFFTPDGQVDFASDDEPSDAIWELLKTQEPDFQEVQAPSGETVLAGPVRGAEYTYGWLAVVLPPGQVPMPLVRRVARNAQHLLAVPFQARLTAVEEERAARARLLWAAIDNRDLASHDEIAGKAAALGLDLDESAWLCVARDQIPIASVETTLRIARLPYLLGERDGLVSVLVQGSRKRVIDWVSSAVDQPIGIGRPMAAVSDAPMAFRDAQLALLKAERAADDERICEFESLGFAERLLLGRPSHELAPDVEGRFAKIRERPDLHETLVTYLMSDLDVNATAELMHLHPNSVRYRLRRIEESVGAPLTKVSVLVDLYLEVLADSQGALTPPSRTPR